MTEASRKRKHEERTASDEDEELELKRQKSFFDTELIGSNTVEDLDSAEETTLGQSPAAEVQEKEEKDDAEPENNDPIQGSDGDEEDEDKGKSEEKLETEKVGPSVSEKSSPKVEESIVAGEVTGTDNTSDDKEKSAVELTEKEEDSSESDVKGEVKTETDGEPSEPADDEAVVPKHVFGSGAFGSTGGFDKPSVFGSDSTFGSKTLFGSGSWTSSTPVKNVFADDSSSTDTTKKTTPDSSSCNGKVFGSGTVFGSGLGSSAPNETTSTNVFETLPDREEEDKEGPTSAVLGENKEDNPNLQVRTIETGEESEDSVFSCRGKLYALDVTAEQMAWKERGVGTLHLNRHTGGSGPAKSRIVMRSDGSLRVILNLLLLGTTELNKGMASSFASEKFVRVTGVEEGKPIQYAIKTGNAIISEQLYDAIADLIAKE